MRFFAKLIFLWGIILSATSGCEQDESFIDAVDFEFRLLNENGVPATIFYEGENFVFSFLIINHSDEQWLLNGSQLGGSESSDFFKVYKAYTNSQGQDSEIDIGKPWKTMFCQYMNGLFISPHDTLKLEIPWMPQPWDVGNPYYNTIFCLVEEHNALPVGKYSTGFFSTFSFSRGEDISYTTSKLQFQTDFEIK